MSLILKYDLGNPHRLPVGYTPLAYIESTGTLFINSGVVLNSSTSIYKFYCQIETSTRDGHAHSFFGTNAYTTGFMSIYHYTDNNYYSEYIKGLNKGALGEVIAKGTKILYYLEMNLSTKTYKSKIHMHSETTGSFNEMTDTTSLITIFKSNDYSGGYWKCYYFRMFKDNKIIRDFIPAKNSSGVVGLFDCVSQTFFTNQGTGAFIAGPEVVVLPYEYLLVEYLEGTGTLWIDTNYLCNADNLLNLKYKLDAMATDTAVGNNWWACGIGGASGIGFHVGIGAGSSAKPFTFARGISDVKTGVNGSLNTRYKWELDMVNLTYKVWSESGASLVDTTFTRLTPTQSQNLALFRWRSYSNSGYIFGMKIYHMELYNTSSLVRNMIPCYRRSDLKPGMYDTVNNVFYTNAGSGEFILGPTVEESTRQLEYNNAGEKNYMPNSNDISTWTSDGATITLGKDCIELSFSGSGNNRAYYSTSNLWIVSGRLYLVSGRIRTTSGTSTVRFSRSIVDYGSSVNATTTWTNFSTIITTTDTSEGGTVSVQGTSGTTIQLSYCEVKPIPQTNIITLCGLPINIHHSTSNPSSTLINQGSGDFNTNSWIKLPRLQNLTHGSISFWLKVNTLKNIVIVGNEDELYYLGATRNGTGAWYHHNCGTITTYVDGVIKTTPTADTNWHHIVFTGVNLSTWTTAYLNKYISESSGWNVNGCYYDFRIYDNALTADEVLKIYKGGV